MLSKYTRILLDISWGVDVIMYPLNDVDILTKLDRRIFVTFHSLKAFVKKIETAELEIFSC